MKLWILLLCASVLGTEEQPTTAKRLLKGAFSAGCICVVVGSCYVLLTTPQPQNGENSFVCSQNVQNSKNAVAINAVYCGALALQNTMSNMKTKISKKWKGLWADNTDENGNPTEFLNCSEDIYHLVDSDGKYVLKVGELARRKTHDPAIYLTFQSGPKESCTDTHDSDFYRPNFPFLLNYKFNKNVFYRYVEAETFKKCSPPDQDSSFYITTCSAGSWVYSRGWIKSKFGYCEDNSTANYNKVYLNTDTICDVHKYPASCNDATKFLENGTILNSNHSENSIKFTEEKSSKDGYFYLVADSSSPKQYLQWNPYGSAKMERVQKKMNEMKKNKEENSKQYAELEVLLKQFRRRTITEQTYDWNLDGLETLFLGHESMKIPFKFEKVSDLSYLSTPQICDQTNKTKARHSPDYYN